jgi:hypothetical protein
LQFAFPRIPDKPYSPHHPSRAMPRRTFDSPEELEKRNAEEIACNPDGVCALALLLMFVIVDPALTFE